MRKVTVGQLSDARNGSASEVGVLNKTLDLLECLADGEAWTVAELSERTGVTKAAAYRILHTLERRAYVTRDERLRRYSLGEAFYVVGRALRTSADLIPAARPAMQELWEEYGETVNLGVLNKGQVLYLDMIESEQRLRMASRVGSYDTIHSTALGKAILSHLPPAEARRILADAERAQRTPNTIVALPILMAQLEQAANRGYAVDDEENEVGARCVAAPILDSQRRPLGAISVSAPAWRLPPDSVDAVGQRIREACVELSRSFN